jgi:4-hydroxy-tetrahydrodipicolinate synthase
MPSTEGSGLRGVIAAAPTPVTADLQPDLRRFVRLCRWLLDNGCDALNVCGTNGEATSFTREERMAIMQAAADELPLQRLMTGTGAASVGDAVVLTKHAAALGFAGALLLPPFYYKGVSDDGILAYFERIVASTAAEPIDLYLYNFPQLSGVEYTLALVERLRGEFGGRIAGVKDSSGKPGHAEKIVALSPELRVFPSSEEVLLKARAGAFAGCISGSANVTSALSARAFHDGDEAALQTACVIRALIFRNPPIPSLKAVLAARFADPALETVLPPLTPLSDEVKRQLLRDVAAAGAEPGAGLHESE